MRWIWVGLVAISMAGAAYVTTRGSDGRLIDAMLLFGLIAAVHLVVRSLWLSYASIGETLVELSICEIAVIASLAANPELDEMGGMLNIFIPAFALGVVVLVYTIVALFRMAGSG